MPLSYSGAQLAQPPCVHLAVLMNSKAGAAAANEQVDHVKAALTAAGLTFDLQLCAGEQLASAARAAVASGADVIVAAGGDGTVSSVASGMVGSDVPLAVLPLGTLNHFARDIGMPIDLEQAALAIAGGKRAQVDIGEVNGRFFINNSSIGLYPEIVLSRDSERKRFGRNKWVAMLIAVKRVLTRFPLLLVRVITRSSAVISLTPFLFVGNNAYAINALTLGQRERLDSGLLSVHMVRCTGRLKMFWLLFRAVLQRLEDVRDFTNHSVTELRVDLPRRRLEVALDGEVAVMDSPLHFRVRPGGLSVLVPAA